MVGLVQKCGSSKEPNTLKQKDLKLLVHLKSFREDWRVSKEREHGKKKFYFELNDSKRKN